MLGHRQTGQANARTRSRRLVHLTVHQGALGAFAAAFLVDAGFDHFPVKIVAFTGPFANTGEDGVTAVRLGDIVDQFHDQNGLADASAAEQADLAALGVRRQQVDDLDAGNQDLRFRRLLDIGGSRLVNAAMAFSHDRAGFVHRFADHVHDTPKRTGADGDRNRSTGVRHLKATNQTFGGVHGDCANGVFAQMLRHFQNQAVALVLGFKRIQNFRQATLELDVDDGADDLGDPSDLAVSHHTVPRLKSVRALPRPR